MTDNKLFNTDELADLAKSAGVNDPDILPPGDSAPLSPADENPVLENQAPPEDVIPDLGLPEEVVFGSESPAPDKKVDPIDQITSESIKVESYPEAARQNVGNLRKRIERDEQTIRAIKAAGVEIEHTADGKVVVKTKPSADPEEVQKLTKRVEEQESVIGRLSLMETRAFKEQYEEPANQQLKAVYDTLLSMYPEKAKEQEFCNTTAQTVRQLAAITPVARAEWLRENIGDQAAVILPLYSQFDAIANRRAEALKNWKETVKVQSQQEAAQIHAQTVAIKDKLKADAITQLSDKGYFMLKKVTGTDQRSLEWNKQVDAMHQSISTFFSDPDPRIASEAFVRAGASEYLLGFARKQNEIIGALRKRLEAYGDTEAGVFTQKPNDKGRQIRREMTPDEVAAEIVRRI